ncbi:MAG: hypothetical protein D4R64_03010 [Porphyromonadaceae bacterium]|nr:MAG: hypothetical protein D4R64_03010 [Porphyromonadaceae bacterium]
MRFEIDCFDAVSIKFYHSGNKKKVPHSTLADANELRDWRIYGDFSQVLIPESRKLNQQDSGFSTQLSLWD